jgi:hypothetical protein
MIEAARGSDILVEGSLKPFKPLNLHRLTINHLSPNKWDPFREKMLQIIQPQRGDLFVAIKQ